MAVSKDERSQQKHMFGKDYLQSTNMLYKLWCMSRQKGEKLTGFLSMRQRIHAPLLRTSWTSFLRSALNLLRTLGFCGLGEEPKSFTKPLVGVVFGFMAIGRGYDAAR
jgi:hypothetical protein